jgi:general secretion pathway protein K
VTIAVMAIVLADMNENAAAAYSLASTQRDRLRAEYLARSGLNLTRLLMSQRPQIRQAVTPAIQMMTGRPPGNVQVWRYANEVLQPFCDYERAMNVAGTTTLDLLGIEGLGETNGTCEIIAFAENSRINVNRPVEIGMAQARKNVAMQLYGLTSGYQQPSPYDPLFEQRDADGLITTRLDIISALIDWWDYDQLRATFDPGAGTVTDGGAEDDATTRFRDPYEVRNAPMDSVEELRLVRGVTDDFWATFIEPDPDDPTSRRITVYGSGRLNPNESGALEVYGLICAVLSTSTLCSDATEGAKFIQLLETVRSIAPFPWFQNVGDFANFLRGSGGQMNLYQLIQQVLSMQDPTLAETMLFRPIEITAQQQNALGANLVFGAEIIFVQSTGRVGRCRPEEVAEQPGRCVRVRLRSVLNFHDRWAPPPPNPGLRPRLGIYHYFRMD